jgi:NADH-quinone oxidoreductase subunit L
VVTDIKRVIAYSTMSQIGYMIMAVSVASYAAGMFHLMTHAFFKALLFMAAGSVIGAMGGEQSLDRMGGFRRAMPFTYACFLIGGLALSAIPPLSGFFSKDDILLVVGERGGWHWALYVIGYIGAFLTPLYTFRMIFRAFHGDPVPEALELEHGHLHHAERPFNPATGEAEDTDVGFPGPEHPIAERELPMKVAMGLLAVGAVFAGALQIPRVTSVVDKFLAPAFRDSRLYDIPIKTANLDIGLALSVVLAVLGIAIAYRVWVARPGTSARLIERFGPVHALFANAWYFNEAIDLLIARPGAWTGRVAQQTFERAFVDRTLVGGPTAIVRAGSAAVRGLQTGLLRYYAALLVFGAAAVGLYFLLQS